MLAIAIDSEFDLNIDMYKTLKMLAIHELEETIMKDYSMRDTISREEKQRQGRECVQKVTEGLFKQNEIILLLKVPKNKELFSEDELEVLLKKAKDLKNKKRSNKNGNI